MCDWVEDHGQDSVSCRWVFPDKLKGNGSRMLKPRLVAQGFEEKSMNERTDSPTCSCQALRMVFVSASIMLWELLSLDITSAFLQGNNAEREVFVRPPSDIMEEGKIWKLQRCIYGLNDTPREWHSWAKQELLKLGGRKNLYDEAMFQWNNKDGALCGILVTHVDDFAYCSTLNWHKNVVEKPLRIFKISKKEKGSFRHVRLNVVQTCKEVFVDQNNYTSSLKPVELSAERLSQKDEELTTEEKSKLRSINGPLLWVTSQTHPDASFDSCRVSNYGKKSQVEELIRSKQSCEEVTFFNIKIGLSRSWKP